MIRLPNGSAISEIAISTALGHSCGGIFPYTLFPAYRALLRAVMDTRTTVLSKSSTPLPTQGNVTLFDPRRIWTLPIYLYTCKKYIKKLPGNSLANAYGLTNNGTKHHLSEIRRSALSGIKAVPNIFLPLDGKPTEVAVGEALAMAQLVVDETSLPHSMVEWNWSCPNTRHALQPHCDKILAIRSAVRRRHPSLTFCDKMSVLHDIALMQEMEKVGNTIFDLFNAVRYNTVFPRQNPPIEGVTDCAYSGRHSKPMVYDALVRARKALKSPIIMGHGVEGDDDVRRLKDIGADCVYICKMATLDPRGARGLIEKYNRNHPDQRTMRSEG